ncbi:MAG: recombinase RecT [Bacteroidales bacterium]
MTAKEKVKESMQQSISKRVSEQRSLAGLTQKEVSVYLEQMQDRLQDVLPSFLTPARVIQMCSTVISRNPEIAKCQTASVLGAVMQAAILGFEPCDALGYCYFVPYNQQLTFQIGYKGYIELARRSGGIKKVWAEVVKDGDDFSYELGLSPTLSHKPALPNDDKALKYVYAVCKFDNDELQFVVLSKNDIERLRMKSPSQRGAATGAWKTDYEAMAKAKALKQLAKYLPLSINTQKALAADDQPLTPDNFEAGGVVKVEDIEYVPADIEQKDVKKEVVQSAVRERIVQSNKPAATSDFADNQWDEEDYDPFADGNYVPPSDDFFDGKMNYNND